MREGQYIWRETNGGSRPVLITSKSSFDVCHTVESGERYREAEERSAWADFKEMVQIFIWRLK